jgi:hypothetical protein
VKVRLSWRNAWDGATGEGARQIFKGSLHVGSTRLCRNHHANSKFAVYLDCVLRT